MIERCWSKNPTERPTFEELFKKLAYNIEDSVGDDIYVSKDLDPSKNDDEDSDDEENKYYLEGVDVDEVVLYADDIDEAIAAPLDLECTAKETNVKELIENAIKARCV